VIRGIDINLKAELILSIERRLEGMELKQIFEIQKTFDRRMGWNRYEKCKTQKKS